MIDAEDKGLGLCQYVLYQVLCFLVQAPLRNLKSSNAMSDNS